MEIKFTMKNATDFINTYQLLDSKLVLIASTFFFFVSTKKATKPGVFNGIWKHSWKERNAHEIMISGVLNFVTKSKLLCILFKAVLPKTFFTHLEKIL